MEVKLDKGGKEVEVVLTQEKDLYYLSTYQARWREDLSGAKATLFLPTDAARELLEKLQETLPPEE